MVDVTVWTVGMRKTVVSGGAGSWYWDGSVFVLYVLLSCHPFVCVCFFVSVFVFVCPFVLVCCVFGSWVMHACDDEAFFMKLQVEFD